MAERTLPEKAHALRFGGPFEACLSAGAIESGEAAGLIRCEPRRGRRNEATAGRRCAVT